MPAELEVRAPYVQFEIRAEEDRTRSMETGSYQSRDVAYVIITPQGSKDRIDREAMTWFAQKEHEVMENRLPREWLRAWREAFAAWQSGQEAPVNGTALKNWPMLSPSQRDTALRLGLRSVEDLATSNEETLSRLGMGGRMLKQKAQDWLASEGSEGGKQVEKLAALTVRVEELARMNEALIATNAELKTRVPAEAPVRPTRGARAEVADIEDIIR